MAFFTISPPAKLDKDLNGQIDVNQSNAVCELCLAPFSRAAELDFKDIKIGTSSVKSIIIQNPTENQYKVILLPPKKFEEKGFTLSETIFSVPSRMQVHIELEWTPTEVGKWRDIIEVKQYDGHKKFSHIILSSNSISLNKKPQKMLTLKETPSLRRDTYDVPPNEVQFAWTSTPIPNKELTRSFPEGTESLCLSIPKILADVSFGISNITTETKPEITCLKNIENTIEHNEKTPDKFVRPKPVLNNLKTSQRQLVFNNTYNLDTSAKENQGSTTMTKEELKSACDELYTLPPVLDIYGVTAIQNPFAKNSFYPEKWLDKHGIELIKWINSVLTPPEEINNPPDVDIALLWKKTVMSESVILAPTKESVSSQYHKNDYHLLSLRKSAMKLLKTEQIGTVLNKINCKVQSGYLAIKDDADLYFDQGMRYRLVKLVTYYHPLWLRIGLETIYGQTIENTQNSVIGSIIVFLKNNFLCNNDILKKNSYSNIKFYKMPSFKNEMNNFIVFKFLALVFFLDQAKSNRLIPYDPCLFNKNSPIKESEEMLNEFIKDFVKCVGHMKKTLKHLGYVLSHKQTYLDEYNYAVTSHLDLRDGVCLTKATEIILKDLTLLQKLRTPALSRLQKVNNVKVALNALIEKGFEIEDVTVNEIVLGHRQKIMSLLWQILHKFLAPRYECGAVKIQIWWKKGSLKREINNRIEIKKHIKISDAAVKIQSWWRGSLLRKKIPQIKISIELYKKERTLAATKIQNWFKQILHNKMILTQKLNSAIKIQRWWRSIILMKLEESRYQTIKSAVLKIQYWFRRTKKMHHQVALYQKTKSSTIKIQRWYRNVRLTKKEVDSYKKIKSSVIKIQTWWRSIQLTLIQVASYKKTKKAAITIQDWYRRTKLMQKEINDYKKIKTSVIKIQQWWISIVLMRAEVVVYQKIKSSVSKIQDWYRRTKLMHNDIASYKKSKESVVKVQKWWKSIQLMRLEVAQYKRTRTAVIKIQNWYRNTKLMQIHVKKYQNIKSSSIKIQKWWKSLQLTKLEMAHYQHLKTSTIKIQNWYRSTKLMHKEKKTYQNMRLSAIKVQKWWRNVLLTIYQIAQYQKAKSSVIKLQNWYRKNKLMQKELKIYLNKKSSAIMIQRWWKNQKLMKTEVARYQKIRTSTIKIQNWYRNTKLMHKEFAAYQQKKTAATLIQKWWKNEKLVQIEVARFQNIKNSTIKIQNWYKRTKLMHKEFAAYQQKKTAATLIQKWWKNEKLVQNEVARYQNIKSSTIKIQNWYRRTKLMQKEKKSYQNMKLSAIKIQQWWKSVQLTQLRVAQYQNIKNSTIKIQNWYRRTKLMQKDFEMYQNQKLSCIKIQNWWRSIQLTQKEVARYQNTKDAIIKIQIWYRCTKKMQNEVKTYQNTKSSAIMIQRWWKNKKLVQNEVARYQNIKNSTIKIQNWYRRTKLMQKDFQLCQNQKLSCIKIQNWWRSIQLTQKEVASYQNTKDAISKIQIWYRCTKKMQNDVKTYQNMKSSAIVIQRWWKNKKLIQNEVARYQNIKNSTVKIQNWYRRTKLMKKEFEIYQNQKLSCIKIQNWWRSVQLTQKEVARYQNTKDAISKIQIWYRCTKKMQNDVLIYKNMKLSTLKIQRWWRNIKLVQFQIAQYQIIKNAVIKIQKWYRGRKQVQKDVSEYQIKRTSAIIIQRWFRNIKLIEYEKRCKMNWATVKIQALWRGYKSRKVFKFVPKVVPTWSSKENKSVILSDRFHAIVTLLKNTTSMKVIYNGLCNLDYIILYSPNLSYSLMEIKEVHDKFYSLLNTPSRSDAYERVFTLILNILLNACLYPKALDSLWKFMKIHSGQDTFLILLRKFYKSNKTLFCKTATILYAICLNEEKAKELLDISDVATTLKFVWNKRSKSDTGKRIIPKLIADFGYKNYNEFQCQNVALEELAKVLKIKL